MKTTITQTWNKKNQMADSPSPVIIDELKLAVLVNYIRFHDFRFDKNYKF